MSTEQKDGAVVEPAVIVGNDFPAIDTKAWSDYNNPVVLGGVRPRGILPLALAYEVSRAIGRPLTQEDLRVLIQKDGELVQCVACGRAFQPVRWAEVNDSLITALRGGIEPSQLNGQVRWSGSFIVKVNDRGVPSVLPFCGAFFFFDPKREGRNGGEFFAVNHGSCLGKAYKHTENCDKDGRFRPVRSLQAAEDLITSMKRKHEERQAEFARQRVEQAKRQAAVASGVADAFAKAKEWRPGRK